VVRLTRTGDATRAAHLDAEQVAELWTDPVLRYSNVLDGLFTNWSCSPRTTGTAASTPRHAALARNTTVPTSRIGGLAPSCGVPTPTLGCPLNDVTWLATWPIYSLMCLHSLAWLAAMGHILAWPDPAA